MTTTKTTPQDASWYAHAVIGSDDDTSEVDGYFKGGKPGRADVVKLPAGWKILEFRVRACNR